MRIVFMGTPEFAVPSLQALIRSENQIVGVVTQPDRPKGRGHHVAPPPVKLVAQEAGIPVVQPHKIRTPEFLEVLSTWKPDLIAVTAFGRILHASILKLPPIGCVNVHGSLLPKYRGAAPIQWAVINGETETGITTMLMDEGMDTGPMLLQERILIEQDDTAGTVAARLAAIGGRLLVETITQLKAGVITPRAQDASQATLAPLLKKTDGVIDWSGSAPSIVNRIRGLTPWPGAYTFCGDERWNIWSAVAMPHRGQEPPGMIIDVTKGSLQVATGEGVLEIREIQPAGSKRLTAKQFLAGRTIHVGARLNAGAA